MSDLKITHGLIIPQIVTGRGELGKYLAKVRIDLNLTQKKLAELIGTSGAMLSAIESRKKSISRSQVDRFIKEMGLDDMECYEFLKLAIMHNVTIEAEKVINKMTYKGE